MMIDWEKEIVDFEALDGKVSLTFDEIEEICEKIRGRK